LRTRYKTWLAAVAGLVAATILAALVLPRSFQLTAFSDVVQDLLLASGALAFLPLAIRSRGRLRLFWSLIALGISFWFLYQSLWVYYEVILRVDVPDLFAGDVILFLHIVPLMAALALRPHVPRDEYAARVGRLDFALLLLWWLYLYILLVMPWQYAVADVEAYNRHLNVAYISEEVALLLGLFASWMTSKGAWKNLFASLLGMSFCYASSSTLANWAIARHVYYSGSLYDIPMLATMAWLTWIGLRAKEEGPATDAREVSTLYGVWVARCSMITVFSLPLFAAWALSNQAVPSRVRVFRLTLTLIAAFFMGLMVFLRQYLLDRELLSLLNHSRESFDNLKRLQAQILQSEKLASIGQLVGGAAHELNNPITAMLGYSDMLDGTPLTPEQQTMAAKIGQQVRRTKSLVANLISFAQQTPAVKSPIDVNTLARTAVKLTESQWKALEIEIRLQLDSGVPRVLGDSNQLLQVCLQLLANCLCGLGETGGRSLTISTERQSGTCILCISTGAPAPSSSDANLASQQDPEDGFGLAACQGILQEHQGQVSRQRLENGAILLRVELPLLDSAPATAKESTGSTVPVLWQSRPYA